MTWDLTGDNAERVVEALFGDSRKIDWSRLPAEIRVGNRGSLAVSAENATWYDFETEEGGHLSTLIKREVGLHNGRDLRAWLADVGVPEEDLGGRYHRFRKRTETDGNGQDRGQANGHDREHTGQPVAEYVYRVRSGWGTPTSAIPCATPSCRTWRSRTCGGRRTEAGAGRRRAPKG